MISTGRWGTRNKMKVQMSLSFLPFLILTVLGEVDTKNGVTCTCPETVIEGDPVILTCTYNEDMERGKQGFYIVRKQTGQEAVIVAICDWGESFDALDCNLKSGYNVTVRGYSVILNIPSVQQEHAGVYLCNKLPADPNADVEGCTLTVQAKQKAKLDISCQKHGKEASVMCTFPKDLHFNSIILEKHDLAARKSTKVDIMRCYRDKETCEVKHRGYLFSSSSSTHTKSKGVILLAKDVSNDGFYVCRTDSDSSYHDMCMLTLNNDTDKPKAEDVCLKALTAPLYAILGCLVIAVVVFLIVVLLRKRMQRQLFTRPNSLPHGTVQEEAIEMMMDNENGAAGLALPNGHSCRETPNG